MICLIHLKQNFICQLILPKCCQSLQVKNRLGQNPTDHTFSVFLWTYICLECCNTSSKVHSTEIKIISDKIDCSPQAFLPWPVGRNESFWSCIQDTKDTLIMSTWSVGNEHTTQWWLIIEGDFYIFFRDSKHFTTWSKNNMQHTNTHKRVSSI